MANFTILNPSKTLINVFYIDDNDLELKRFVSLINDYNGEEKEQFDIVVETFLNNVDELQNRISSKNCDIIFCDQNMAGKTGLELINYLRTDDDLDTKNICFILYTAFPSKILEEKCKKNEVTLILKNFDGEILINDIIKVFTKHNSSNIKEYTKFDPVTDIYEKIANDLITDIETINHPSELLFSLGDQSFNANDYYFHLKNKTNYGKQFVDDYYEGLKFFNS